MEIVIDKGIPIPPTRGGSPARSEYRIAMDSMEIGDSFVVFGKKQYAKVRNIQREYQRINNSVRFTIRKDAEEGFWRIWRIE